MPFVKEHWEHADHLDSDEEGGFDSVDSKSAVSPDKQMAVRILEAKLGPYQGTVATEMYHFRTSSEYPSWSVLPLQLADADPELQGPDYIGIMNALHARGETRDEAWTEFLRLLNHHYYGN